MDSDPPNVYYAKKSIVGDCIFMERGRVVDVEGLLVKDS